LNGDSFTGTSEVSGVQPCDQGSGLPTTASVDFTAANGDSLHTATSGDVCQSSSTTYEVTGTYTITGGSGCFESADGSGVATAHVEYPNGLSTTGLVDLNDNGTITLKQQPPCT